MYSTVFYSPIVFVLLVMSSSTIGARLDISRSTLDAYPANGLNTRIVNGNLASLGQFSHQVSLRRSWSDVHFCGGSAIGEQWILTAAHCMFLNKAQIEPWSILVVGGEILLDSTSPTGQRSGVTDIIMHKNFDQLTLQNDVALLKLETPFVYNTAALMTKRLQTESVSSGIECQVAGWGHPDYDIHVSTNELMYVDLPILDVTVCRELLVNYSEVPDGMLCAGYVDGSKGACQGDSGGGLICNGVITGIVSRSIGCAWPNHPDIYTDVQYYRSWILEYTGSGASGFGPSTWTFVLLLSVIISAAYV